MRRDGGMNAPSSGAGADVQCVPEGKFGGRDLDDHIRPLPRDRKGPVLRPRIDDDDLRRKRLGTDRRERPLDRLGLVLAPNDDADRVRPHA
jgi:hypothetical protein